MHQLALMENIRLVDALCAIPVVSLCAADQRPPKACPDRACPQLACFVPHSVSVRVRPLSVSEQERGGAWRIDQNRLVPLTAAGREENFSLDTVFDSNSTTEEVYHRTTEDIINKVVGGFNGTVFAYGQTSSGKTHTMRGSQSCPGIIPMAVQAVFDHIEHTQDREFLLRVSYVEVRSQLSTAGKSWLPRSVARARPSSCPVKQ